MMKCEEAESFSEGRAILRHLLECGRNEPDLDLLFSFLKFKVLIDGVFVTLTRRQVNSWSITFQHQYFREFKKFAFDAAVILLDFGTIDEIFELKTFFLSIFGQ